MRFPPSVEPSGRRRRPRAAVVVLMGVVAALSAACSSDDPEGLPRPTVTVPTVSGLDRPELTETASADEAAPSGSTPSTDVDQQPWPTPRAFRAFVAELDQPSVNLRAMADAASDQELIELAERVCRRVEPDMTPSELGVAALAAVQDLGPAVQQLTSDETSLVFGALAGLHCPERLPLSGQRVGAPRPGPETRGPTGFRAVVAQWWSPTHGLRRMVAAIDDERLATMADGACALAGAEQSTTRFGLATTEHFETVLTEAERSQVGAAAHQELFGALVGWFCPERLPSID